MQLLITVEKRFSLHGTLRSGSLLSAREIKCVYALVQYVIRTISTHILACVVTLTSLENQFPPAVPHE